MDNYSIMIKIESNRQYCGMYGQECGEFGASHARARTFDSYLSAIKCARMLASMYPGYIFHVVDSVGVVIYTYDSATK